MKRQNAKSWILSFVKKKGSVSSPLIVKALRISRQSAAQHLRELADAGKIFKVGSTKKSQYVSKEPSQKNQLTYYKYKSLEGMDEFAEFEALSAMLRLKATLGKKAYAIVSYAFTEMLNNAIDHSRSSKVEIFADIKGTTYFTFSIRDRGVGVFENIRKKYSLVDQEEAIGLLLSGKKTTMPDRHSGEGIFFTSKIADYFALSSARLKLIIDPSVPDEFIVKARQLKGTSVEFKIKRRTKKTIKNIFDAYTNEEFTFDKSRAAIKLYKKEGAYVSRSEARRLLSGMEEFKRIQLDFSDISGIGQAFADEIFRVYKLKKPEVEVEVIHANQAVLFMIKRAQQTLQSKKE